MSGNELMQQGFAGFIAEQGAIEIGGEQEGETFEFVSIEFYIMKAVDE